MTTLDEIANEMFDDARVDESGWTSKGRMDYVMFVMQKDSIDLLTRYDFSSICECDVIEIVDAAGHLASLQMEFFNRCHDAILISDGDFMLVYSYLTLELMKISWHAQHLRDGEATPPYFPFIH